MLVLAAGLAAAPTAGASDRESFVERVIGDTLDSPVSMAFAPDGRLFVCEQGGRLRVIERGRLLAKPFATLPVYALAEQGLLGVAFDPAFAINHRLYVAYTYGSPARHQRLSRLTAAGNTAVRGSETVLFEMDQNLGQVHVGGAVKFGPDGMLYLGTGDNNEETRAQSLRSTFGKILRLRPDGGIPADNPFYTIAIGNYRAIWARGLRNAFAFDFDRRTRRMFINDVGGSRFEEINYGAAGGNYGWPVFEGPSDALEYRAPVHAYDHDHGCAISGGAFYEASKPSFSSEWLGRYFFAEYCRSEIRWIDPAAPDSSRVFLKTRVAGPVDLRVGPDGDLYYLARGTTAITGGDHTSKGLVVRVSPAGGAGAANK